MTTPSSAPTDRTGGSESRPCATAGSALRNNRAVRRPAMKSRMAANVTQAGAGGYTSPRSFDKRGDLANLVAMRLTRSLWALLLPAIAASQGMPAPPSLTGVWTVGDVPFGPWRLQLTARGTRVSGSVGQAEYDVATREAA